MFQNAFLTLKDIIKRTLKIELLKLLLVLLRQSWQSAFLEA